MKPTVIGHIKDADGFHVNLPKPDPRLADYLCDPQPVTPTCVYQGGIMPVCYKFDSREQWDEVNPFKVDKNANI